MALLQFIYWIDKNVGFQKNFDVEMLPIGRIQNKNWKPPTKIASRRIKKGKKDKKSYLFEHNNNNNSRRSLKHCVNIASVNFGFP